MEKSVFALALNEHRLWGWVLLPMMIERNRDESYYSPKHVIFPSETDDNFMKLNHTEKEIVRIIDQYSEKHLFKIFSRDKNLREFQEKISDEKRKQFIRPYIEKRLIQVFEILRETNIKLFFREHSRANVFEEDFLKVLKEKAEPVFNFFKNEEGTKYSLELYFQNKKIDFQNKYLDIICNNPALLRINRRILFVREIEAKKIRPFFNKDLIFIPLKTENQYYKTFLLNLIAGYEVHAEGFEIRKTKPRQSSILSLEKGFADNAVLLLKFQYGNKTLLANSPEKVFVDLHHDKDKIYYDKYLRDEDFEESVHDLLNDLGLISFDQVNYELKGNRQLDFQTQLFELIDWLGDNYEEFIDTGITLEQNIARERYYLGSKKLQIRSELKTDWFDIHAVLEIGEFKIPLPKFKRNILENDRQFVLPDKRLFIIPFSWLRRFKELFEFGKISNELIRIHKQHFFIIEKIEQDDRSFSFENLKKLNKREDLSPIALPSGITAELRPYQMEGYTWLFYLQQHNLCGCLADDMGLGKTLQAICLLQKNKEDNTSTKKQDELPVGQLSLFDSSDSSNQSSLVIVPASLVYNWVNEIKRFAPGMKVYAYVGNQRNKEINIFSSYDIIISTYHTVRQDIDLLSIFPFHVIILDESQVIKNPGSKIYRAVNLLNSRYRIALTGTPIENSLTDLWAQMNFLNKGLLGNLNFFRKEYVIPIERRSLPGKEEELKKLINPFILRRTKEEVARDLPEISEQVIYCGMSDEQRKFYEEEKESIRNSIFLKIDRDGIEKSSMIVLQGLTRLRQASNHPLLADENYRHDSGKYNEIMRNIGNILLEGHKVLVYSSFVKHLELIRAGLEEENIKYTKLTGASVKRENIVKAFQDNPSCHVFLISLKAGGLGLNLTAADYVFILDPWWNPASEEQAVNRAHRIGQKKNVFVYRFISENSIEEKIQLLQERKSKLAGTFIHSNNPMKEISKKQLEELFS